MITHYCIIRNHTIIIDGKILFNAQTQDLNDFLLEAYAFLKISYPKFYKMDNLAKLGFLAAEVLLTERHLAKDYSPEGIALVLSNAHSSLDTDLRYHETSKTLASPALFVYTLPNIVAGEICIRHKIKGENAFFISPKFDPELLSDYASMILHPMPDTQSPMPNVCIAGWVDLMVGHHDVFLYLLEKNKPALLPHSAKQLQELYSTNYGTIDGQSEKADH